MNTPLSRHIAEEYKILKEIVRFLPLKTRIL